MAWILASGLALGDQDESEFSEPEPTLPPTLVNLQAVLAELPVYDAMLRFSHWEGDNDPTLQFLKWGGNSSLPYNLSRLEEFLEGNEDDWRALERAVTGEPLNLIGRELMPENQNSPGDGGDTLRGAMSLLTARLSYLASRGPRTDEKSGEAWDGLAASLKGMKPNCIVEQLIHRMFVSGTIRSGRVLAIHGGRAVREKLRAALPLAAPLKSSVMGEERFIRLRATLEYYDANKGETLFSFRDSYVEEQEILASHPRPFDEEETRLLLDELHTSVYSIIAKPFPWSKVPDPRAVVRLQELWPVVEAESDDTEADNSASPPELSTSELASLRSAVHDFTNAAGVLQMSHLASVYQLHLDSFVETTLRERLFLVELAMLDYRSEHGKLPSSLADLNLEREVVTDPLTGRSLLYKRDGATLSTADPDLYDGYKITIGDLDIEPYIPYGRDEEEEEGR